MRLPVLSMPFRRGKKPEREAPLSEPVSVDRSLRLPTTKTMEQTGNVVDSEEFDRVGFALRYAGVSIGSIVPTEKETKLVALAKQRVEDSALSKKVVEGRYKESLAFFLGDQWMLWDSGSLIDTRDLYDADRIYTTVNRIKPGIRKHLARALAARTTTSISPATGRQVDLLSARQARAIASHLEYVLRDEVRQMTARFYCHAFGPIGEFTYIDKNTEVPMPMSLDGEYEIEDVKLGEVCGETLLWTEIYPDPKATDLDEDADWLCIAKRRSLNAVYKAFPDLAKWEIGDSSGTVPSLKNEVDQITGNRQNSSASGKKETTVITLFEQPGDLYEDGLYLVVVGDRVAEVRDWPYKTLKHPTKSNRYLFPVTMLQYQQGVDTIWGDNAVSAVIPLQRTRNRLISRIDEHTREGDGKLLAMRGMEISAKAFKTGRRNEIVEYTGSEDTGWREPKWLQKPPLDVSTFQLLASIDRTFDEIMEVADVSRGLEPSAGTSGVALQAMQDADQSSAALFTQQYREYLRTVTYKRLKLAEMCYTTNRLVYVQDTAPTTPAVNQAMDAQGTQPPLVPSGTGYAPPRESAGQRLANLPMEIQTLLAQQGQVPSPMATDQPLAGEPDAQPGDAQKPNEDDPKFQAQSFKTFAKGRYTVEVAIASVRTPAQRTDMIFKMAAAKMFEPAQIPITITFLQLMEIENSDKLTTDLIVALRQIQKREDALKQAEAEAEAQKQQAAIAAQQEMQANKGQQDAQVKMAQNEHDGQVKMAISQAEGKLKMALEAQKAVYARGTEAARAEADIAVESAKAELKKAELTHKAGLGVVTASHNAVLGHHQAVQQGEQAESQNLQKSELAKDQATHGAGIAREQTVQNSEIAREQATHTSQLTREQAEHAAKLAPKDK